MTDRLDSADPATVFANLAQILYAGRDHQEVLDALCVAAVTLVDGCDHASMMMKRDDKFVTGCASDDVARRADALEREIGDGPCVDAITEEAYQLDPDLTEDSAWPKLADRLVEETPVRGAAAFRLVVSGQKLGALNLFSDRPGSMTRESADQAAILAAFASVVLTALDRDEQAESLQRGLESNREIGKAVGLLMAAHQVPDDEAFDLLRKASQDVNMKISDIAREVVEHHRRR